MIFPIGDDQVQGGHKPLFSYTFIGLNVLIFLYQLSLPLPQCQGFLIHFGVIPAEALAGQDLYTFITNMFLHGGWMHLIGNMMFLWVFADNIEAIVGNARFFLFYILGGVVASVVHVMFNVGSPIPAVGASGAIAAVLGAYLVMFPRSKVKLIVILFFYTFRIPAILFLGIWIAQQLLNGVGAIGGNSAHTGGVAWWAHIGGFGFGLLAGLLFRRFFNTSLDQTNRRSIYV